MTRPTAICHVVLLVTASLVAGCQTPGRYSQGRQTPYGRSHETLKPLMAVTDFENRSNFTGRWNLGQGMADLLTTELLQSKRVTVLERKHLDHVVGEIMRQGQGLFRKEGRVERGRLKNAKFLVRGVVTDFTVTSEASGWFGIRSFAARGRGRRSRVAINIAVSDVESGEIISSVKANSAVSAGGFGASVDYKRIAFGGDTFFQTPLGRATEAAIAKAVRQILRDLPIQYWKPRVAEGGPDMAVINGGENVRLRAGDIFVVREEGRTVTDPVTGNVLETVPGRVMGKLRVTEVKPMSAHAAILEGSAERGDMLEAVEP